MRKEIIRISHYGNTRSAFKMAPKKIGYAFCLWFSTLSLANICNVFPPKLLGNCGTQEIIRLFQSALECWELTFVDNVLNGC